MAKAAKQNPRHIGIGFVGGQSLALRVSEKDLGELTTAVRTGSADWYEVETIDGAVLVDIGKVVYVRVEADDQHVGF